MKHKKLQFFAESEETTETADTTTETENTATDDPKEKTYTQAEVDELIKTRLSRERKRQEKATSEAEKLAKMSTQEQAEYQREQKIIS